MIKPPAFRAAAVWMLAASAQAGVVTMTVTDREGRPVADAVVVISPSMRTTPKTPLPATLHIAQEKMQFVPAVTLAPLGARVVFVNNDTWEHHIRVTAGDLAQLSRNDAGGVELRLDGKPAGRPAKEGEVLLQILGPVLLGCHLHSSMRGHIYVTDSPWSAKTAADGTASFSDVPDGAASIRVWHPDQLLDQAAQAVTVGAKPVTATTQLQVVPRRRRI